MIFILFLFRLEEVTAQANKFSRLSWAARRTGAKSENEAGGSCPSEQQADECSRAKEWKNKNAGTKVVLSIPWIGNFKVILSFLNSARVLKSTFF